ncbi:MAG: hypothetical protein LUG88_02695 [Clostridia bacterium]|nr:hypothetical protein [Clostridia bacterium]
MIKGCERRMIKIENPDSELFESAYFIIRQNVPVPKKAKRGEMMREAVRIVGDGMGGGFGSVPSRSGAPDMKKGRFAGFSRVFTAERAISFAIGFGSAAAAMLLLRFFT